MNPDTRGWTLAMTTAHRAPESGGLGGPGPDGAADVPGFARDLRDLRRLAGSPSYAELSRRTGLPRSTVYDGLRGQRLPSLALTLAVVRALSGDEEQWRHRWVALRRACDDLARPGPAAGTPAGGPEAAPAVEPGPRVPAGPPASAARSAVEPAVEPAPVPDTGTRRPVRMRRRRLGVLLLLGLVLLAGTGLVVRWQWPGRCMVLREYRAKSPGAVLTADGQVTGRTRRGDLVEVRSLAHTHYAHRYYGTDLRTGDHGYFDEARLRFSRERCA